MLSIFLIDELQKNADTQLIYYFCDHQDKKRNTVTAVLRSLLYQILPIRPELIKHASRFFESPERARQTISSMETLWIILTRFVDDINLGKMYCVLDGLDECEGSQLRALARRLDHLSSPRSTTPNTNAFKVVIVSRPIDGLRKAVQVNLDPDNNEKVASDIEKFIAVRVDELSGISGFSKIRARVQADLLERAEGTFLWVGFAMYELLQKKTLSRVLNALQVLPMGLEAIYDRMLLQIPDEDKHITFSILRWVALALRPLKLKELAAAIGFQSPHALITLEQAICDQVMICEPFLKVQDKEVHLAHQSGRDYLFREKGSGNNGVLKYFRIKPEEAHLELARVCLECIAQNLQHGPVDLKNLQNTQFSELLRYAVDHWPEHVNRCSDLAAQLIDPSTIFYQKQSVVRNHWMASYNPADIEICKYDPMPLLHMACFFHIIPWVKAILSNRNLWDECGCVTEGIIVGITPLHAGFESKGILELLLTNGANVNARTATGQTVLHLAVLDEAPEEIIRRLLENGVDINANDQGKKTALSIATSKHTAIIPLLLTKGADVNIQDDVGDSLLLQEICDHHETVVRMMLQMGIGLDINVKDINGYSPLHGASVTFNDVVGRMLLERGADANAKGYDGITPLHLAIGNTHIIEMGPLSSEARRNIRKANGNSPLHDALCKGIEAIVRMLLDNGADANARSDEGITPLHLMAYFNPAAIEEILKDSTDGQVKTQLENSMLQSTVYDSRKAILRMLLQKEANINAQSNDGNTPLHIAVRENDPDAVRLLLDEGADIDAVNIQDETVLHNAIQFAKGVKDNEGQLAVIRLLLERQVNINTKNKKGQTPLDIAKRLGRGMIVDLLETEDRRKC